jgi:hypothetical protein
MSRVKLYAKILKYCHMNKRDYRGIGNRIYLAFTPVTSSYDTVTELHTPKIAVTQQT